MTTQRGDDMPQTAIFAPRFATMLLTLALWFIAGRAALAYLAS